MTTTPTRDTAPPGALSCVQAARMLTVNYETIRRLVFSGKIDAFKVGRVWRIRRGEIARYAQQRRRDDTAERN